ncbi:PIN domain-containing protein [bacterium]|nr:PIN domain-containing protein [bacterium]
MSKVFVDTNILIYSLYSKDRKRKQQARSKLKELERGNPGVLSTQVLQEFYVVATRRMGVDPLLVKRIVRKLENFETVTVGTRLIHEAIDCSITNEISFWDSLIVVAAQSAKCEVLWTEDLNSGQMIGDVRIINPFLLR